MTIEEPSDDGSTAYGLLLLGEDYLNAAIAASQAHTMSDAPTRLLCLHACELFLKAFLRKQGATHNQLRVFRHDLSRIARAASKRGLRVDPQLSSDLATIADINAYVDVRYEAGTAHGPFSSRGATIRLAQKARELVRGYVFG